MAFDIDRKAQAIDRQQKAAEDPSSQVRLVAGPGSGKSYSIEARVVHLLRSGISPSRVMAVSFTRNSSVDLGERIRKGCAAAGVAGAELVHTGTLHSVALRVMRLANLLTTYPVDPRVLDEWETTEWFDAQFAKAASVTPGRAAAVREFQEAFWSTGQDNPANYVPPQQPVTAGERAAFQAFHQTQTRFYGCLVIGEIVGTCMSYAVKNAIDPRELLGIDHLIVDEYQDLNPMDLAFVDHLASQGVTIFSAGDDDQSVYSFRYAAPVGIQTFLARHPEAGDHSLVDCFRCTPQVLDAALGVISQYATADRIPKNTDSMYSTAEPVVPGHAKWWKYASPKAEAKAIARSCLRLKDQGIAFEDMMILLGNRRVAAATIQAALEAEGVPFSPVATERFRDTTAGRAAFSLLRILTSQDDLVAYRNLLALQPSMGPTRCLDVTTRCVSANVSADDLFRGYLPDGTLTGIQQTSLDNVRALVGALDAWSLEDTLDERDGQLEGLVGQVAGPQGQVAWADFIRPLGAGSTLAEVRDLLYASNVEEASAVLARIDERLGEPTGTEPVPDRVQVMTMHGAKGLSAKVVFIPSLEETVFPTKRRADNVGLTLEGARLLYVSITRAKAAVLLSCVHSRLQNGQQRNNPVSRFLLATGLTQHYQQEPVGIDEQFAEQIAATSGAMQ